MARSYMPESDAGRVRWIGNFSSQLVIHGASLGFTPGEIAQMQNDAAMVRHSVELKEALRKASRVYAVFTESLFEGEQQPMGDLPMIPVIGTLPQPVFYGVLKRIQLCVQRIRMNVNYTETLGREFWIVQPDNSPDLEKIKPQLKIELQDGFPVLSWKRNRMHGIHIYVDRLDGNGFVLLDKRTSTSFTDTSPLPEGKVKVTWQYKAIYIRDDEEVGSFSEPVTAEVVRA